MARTKYTKRYIYGTLNREITTYTVIYGGIYTVLANFIKGTWYYVLLMVHGNLKQVLHKTDGRRVVSNSSAHSGVYNDKLG